MRLSELRTGEKGVIVKVMGRGAFRKRIIEMGFIRGKEVDVIQNAPLKDPIHYRVMGYDVSLRRNDAQMIEVVSVAEFIEASTGKQENRPVDSYIQTSGKSLQAMAMHKGKTINVALVGNPNCGKTSLFNFASGAHEHVGNYSGVTVDAKAGTFHQNDYTFKIVDLPGTYSLSAYTPEELYVRKHLNEEQPDIVINVVDASNLERNLYLTCQLIDMDVRMVIALNMYDELERHGNKFDHNSLSRMIGTPIVPTISKTGFGIEELFNRVIKVYEEEDPVLRHIHINYGDVLEKAIYPVRHALKLNGNVSKSLSKRYLAIKLLEGDPEVESFVKSMPGSETVIHERDRNVAQIETLLKEDCETAFTNARYGFISGALRETYEQNKIKEATSTQIIDLFVTHKVLGFPIFILFMWIMFEATFRLGEYPMEWIESFVGWIGEFVRGNMSEGPLKDLLVDGIIGGVGGVIVFLPNILILYAFISFMEDSGYMARAAFIMDKIMHKMGLHGKSFIPLVMGFGCNVPAIMASRTIESRNSRMITMLVNPLMSCSARLPVYVLLTGAFFPQTAGTVMLIFQPAEEGVRGAKSIVDNGHLDGVDYLIGSHVTNKKEDDPAVVIPGSYGSLATTKYDVIFHGKSAHAGGSPEVGRNVMLAVGTAILNLYAIPRHSGGVSRVNVGTVVAGSGRNVIADEAKMEIEVRGETTEINEYMKNYAVNIIESAAKMHGCTCEMKLMGAANSLASSEALMERVKRVCEEDLHLPVAKEMSSKNGGSEDVSYMMNRVQEQGGQATFMRVLTHEAGPGHSRIFDIDEQVLPNAVKIFCGVVYDIMH